MTQSIVSHVPPLRPLMLTLGFLSTLSCGGAPGLEQEPETAAAQVSDWATTKSYASSGPRVISPERNTGLCLQPANNSTDNGTPVVLGPCNGSALQVWARPDATFRVSNNKCIDVSGGAKVSGTKLQIWDCAKDNSNQKFTISGQSIKWLNTDLCFDLTDGNANSGTVAQIWSCSGDNTNQRWRLQKANSSDSTPQATAAANTQGKVDYLQTRGTSIVDKNNQTVQLRGTNIGGWLVTEGWMNGYTDSSDKDPYRFSLETLERRFGEDRTRELMNVWYDKFITTQDLDNLKGLGVNTLRVPFGYRNLQHKDGSWIKDASGNIDFSRLDWIVTQAAQRGLYTILVFHIWDSQQASYSQISENSDAGHNSLAKAEAIWKEVANHFLGNASIAAFDVINEPTGSWGNLLQDGLYKAVRAVDSDRIIVMESMSADPATLSWKNVVYSIHQYNMMGNDFGANQAAFNGDLNGSIANFRSFNVPTYIGEFMAQESGETLSWLLSQYNNQGLHWTGWTYKTVNMGAWGLCNLSGNVHADLLNDSFDTIKNTWQNMGSCNPEQAMVDTYKKALGG